MVAPDFPFCVHMLLKLPRAKFFFLAMNHNLIMGMGENSNINYNSISDQRTHLFKLLAGLTPEQLNQLIAAISMVKLQKSENCNAFANTAGRFFCEFPSINSVSSNTWILDSGAIDHIAI